MSQKRNEWLEADLEEEEDNASALEEEESRGHSISRRASKKRKLESDDDSLAGQDDLENNEHGSLDDYDAPDMTRAADTATNPSKIEKKLKKVRNATSRSGVVYISRVPPFMKPHTLKNLLLPYASKGIGRIFLTPESHDQRQSRIRGGGNKKKSYTDGWIEFTSKKEAKAAVEILNARTIGGKKGGYYVDDVWNLKYLKGFKWRHLTERIANENAERAARMRAEGSSSRREMNEFLKNVDRSKIEATRQQKRAKRSEMDGFDDHRIQSRDQFRQSKPVVPKDQVNDKAPDIDVQRVLNKIF